VDNAFGCRLADGYDGLFQGFFGGFGILLLNDFEVTLYLGLNGALCVPISYAAFLALNHPFYGRPVICQI
jgi:hypothetical protein